MSDVFGFVISVKEQWRKILTGSLIVALLGVFERIWRIHVPWFVYVLIVGFTLLWAVFEAWRDEHRALKKAEGRLLSNGETRLLTNLRKLTSEYVRLMRDFPDSDAVRSPFNVSWRPSIGTTDVGFDKQQMMAWHKECLSFLNSLAGVVGSEAASNLRIVKILSTQASSLFLPAKLECLMYLDEVETLLLKKVLN